jgi:iron transport multicopper oxidase
MNYTKYEVPINGNIKTFIFNSQHKGENPGYFYFNNETFIHPTNQTLLSSILFNNSQEINWLSTIYIENDEIIDIIINNIDFAPHPFHLHGHHVWILAQGNTNDGNFNQSIISNTYNPMYRDTFTVNAYSYIVFRFKTDNPGIWMMHCHNNWHLQLGMALVFIESKQIIKNFYLMKNLTNYIPLQCQHH